MNITHLKYVSEIARTKSISQAAENLFMSQPNLSRAIKELELSLNIEIFERSSKGMILTPKGEAFLKISERILSEVDEIENLCLKTKHQHLHFSISVPRSSYIAYAFTEFARKLEHPTKYELYYKETNALKTIRNVLGSQFNLGIIRYQTTFDSYYQAMLKEKNLAHSLICHFKPVVIMSKNHLLASKDIITEKDLYDFVEIAHADPYVPDLHMSEVKKIELPEMVSQRIFVFERASQFSLLETMPQTYMWVSRVPDHQIQRYGLIEKEVMDCRRHYKDVLIYRKDYQLTDTDQIFLTELVRQKRCYIY